MEKFRIWTTTWLIKCMHRSIHKFPLEQLHKKQNNRANPDAIYG